MCHKHIWLSFPALEMKKLILILIESGIFLLFYWPNLFGQEDWILASFFFRLLWTSTSSLFIKKAKKIKKELGQYPASLTSRFINNVYESGFVFIPVKTVGNDVNTSLVGVHELQYWSRIFYFGANDKALYNYLRFCFLSLQGHKSTEIIFLDATKH